MRLYLTDKQVPEMSALGASQRRTVRQGAFGLFCKHHPQAQWQLRLANGAAVLVGCAMALTFSHQFLFRLVIGVAVACVIGLAIQSFLTEQLRPYFRRYIEEHSDEISRAA